MHVSPRVLSALLPRRLRRRFLACCPPHSSHGFSVFLYSALPLLLYPRLSIPLSRPPLVFSPSSHLFHPPLPCWEEKVAGEAADGDDYAACAVTISPSNWLSVGFGSAYPGPAILPNILPAFLRERRSRGMPPLNSRWKQLVGDWRALCSVVAPAKGGAAAAPVRSFWGSVLATCLRPPRSLAVRG